MISGGSSVFRVQWVTRAWAWSGRWSARAWRTCRTFSTPISSGWCGWWRRCSQTWRSVRAATLWWWAASWASRVHTLSHTTYRTGEESSPLKPMQVTSQPSSNNLVRAVSDSLNHTSKSVKSPYYRKLIFLVLKWMTFIHFANIMCFRTHLPNKYDVFLMSWKSIHLYIYIPIQPAEEI